MQLTSDCHTSCRHLSLEVSSVLSCVSLSLGLHRHTHITTVRWGRGEDEVEKGRRREHLLSAYSVPGATPEGRNSLESIKIQECGTAFLLLRVRKVQPQPCEKTLFP